MKRFAIVLIPLLLAIGCDKAINPVAPSPKGSTESAAGSANVGEGGMVKIGDENTTISFVGTKPEGKHDGGFKKLDGKIKMTYNGPGVKVEGPVSPISNINVDIDTDTLFADDPKLTQHLKSPDFFDVKKYPKATFASTKIEGVAGKDGEAKVTGDLTLHGVTKSITFPATVVYDRGNLTLSSTFKINRTDFGMTYGKGKVHDDVTVSVAVGKAAK